MRALIDKRKVIQAHLAGTLSRDSAAFIALYEGLKYFERDLSKLQVNSRIDSRKLAFLCSLETSYEQNYIEMNATGFRKILKKWDKRSKSTTKELYLARQVDVQPCFDRDVVSELSDTVAANVRKLEGLCTAKGGETTVDPAADGILSERRMELAVANAEAQDDLLSNLENELISAVRAKDRLTVESIFSNLPSYDSLDSEVRSQLTRIFWRAAILDNSKTTERLLDPARLDFSFVDDINGRTPLIEAAARGKQDLVALCLERGVHVRHRDVYGREAIHYAAMGNAQICSYLLEHGADPNPLDFDGSSPMTHAIAAGQLACVQILIEGGASSEKTGESILPLALAARQGVVAIVSVLLQSGHSISPDVSGFLPQHIAAKEGHVAILGELLQAGAIIDAPDKFANWTALFHAANEGHLECVHSLIRAGASLSAVDEQGKTAIHHAAWSGHPEVVSALLLASPRQPPTPINISPSDQNRKRTSAALTEEMDIDADLIPDLSLPPPALPLRTYGHSYLDSKRSLVQITLGNATTSGISASPIQFYRPDQLSSLKLVITSRQKDSLNIPHTVMLPLEEGRETTTLLVESCRNLTLEFEVFPTFGSRLIGKAVCLPSTFSNLRSIDHFTAAILDTHLAIIGELTFEISCINHFENVQLAIGGRLETYWKSTTTEPTARSSSWKVGNAQELAFITASSLMGEYAKLIVQVTADGVPMVYPQWLLPTDTCALHVTDVTAQDMNKMARETNRTLLQRRPLASANAATWSIALSHMIAPLSDIFSVRSYAFGKSPNLAYAYKAGIAK